MSTRNRHLSHHSRRGFTLVELLVVIAIISILATLGVVGVMSALDAGKEGKTNSLIQSLVAGLEGFSSPSGPGGGTYPPASLDRMNSEIAHDNTNCGIETLLMCLRTTRGGGPFFQVNSWNDLLQDKDDDGMDASAAYQWLQIESTKMQFFELVDPWGNPLVYIPRESYDEEFTILTADDEYVTVKARNIQTGNSGELPPHFVIWSFGKNGINEDGGGDDITSWTKGDDN